MDKAIKMLSLMPRRFFVGYEFCSKLHYYRLCSREIISFGSAHSSIRPSNCHSMWAPAQVHVTHKTKGVIWLQTMGHCSIIDLAHVGEPFIAPPSHNGAISPNGSSWWKYGCTHTNLKELLRELREPYVWMAPLAPPKAPLALRVMTKLHRSPIYLATSCVV